MSQFFTQSSGGGGGGGGDVNGPGMAVDNNAIVRWDGTTGTDIQNSSIILSDAGLMNFPSATGGLTFGDADTTIIETSDDVLVISNAGATTATFNASNELVLANALGVPSGGTGATSLTDGAVLIGDGTDPIEAISLTTGQVLIGSTAAGANPVAAELTAGQGIDITPGDGAITIAAANTVSGTATTTTATPTAVVTQSAGGTPGVYQIRARVAGFKAAATAYGVGYTIDATVRTDGSATTLIEPVNKVAGEEANQGDIDATVVVSGNNFIVQVTGNSDSINWNAEVEWTFVS